ncbi:exosome complex component CSL4-like [Macrotis lagotis]|uniref:exosome complex component CSL4-like n=1 Tax=Macrotis lagotis TaxID=92651 RepID=UPI003D69420E
MAKWKRYCIPGEQLCSLEDAIPGSGTHTQDGYIFSSLLGCLVKTTRRRMFELLKIQGGYMSFRPGDIVMAKVISLSDAQSNCLLTTGENELGVVVAHSDLGIQMVPISWCEMQSPRTLTKESHKVARVQSELLQT